MYDDYEDDLEDDDLDDEDEGFDDEDDEDGDMALDFFQKRRSEARRAFKNTYGGERNRKQRRRDQAA
jgi:hypothetical protein